MFKQKKGHPLKYEYINRCLSKETICDALGKREYVYQLDHSRNTKKLIMKKTYKLIDKQFMLQNIEDYSERPGFTTEIYD